MSLGHVKSHLMMQVTKLGTDKDAKGAPPKSTSNLAGIAWEYFVADYLCSLATKRKENAKKAAEAAGILRKPDPGETHQIYHNETLQIIAKTNNPAETIDPAALNSELMKEVGIERAQQILAKAKKKSAPATSYSFVEAVGERV
jgi:hypothetical protein